MYRAMAVDDEIWVLRGLKKQMEQAGAGFELEQAFTQPLQALSALERHPADVVFVDIQMAGLNGLQFIERAKAVCPRALYVIVSAYSEFGYAQEAIHLGVKAYLVKPIAQADLEALLQSLKRQLDAMALTRGDDFPYRFLTMNARQLPRDALMKELGLSGNGAFCCWASYRRADPEMDFQQLVRKVCEQRRCERVSFASEDGQFHLTLACAPEGEISRVNRELSAAAAAAGLRAGCSAAVSDATLLGEAVLRAQWGALQHFVAKDGAMVEVGEARLRAEIPPATRALLEQTPMHRMGAVIGSWAASLVRQNEQVGGVFYQVFELMQILSRRGGSPRLREMMMALTSPVSMVEAFGTLDQMVSALVECAAGGAQGASGQVCVEQIRAFLDANFSEPILVSEVAAHFSMDAAYLGRMFRQKQGTGIKEYLNVRRMERAGELLETTSLSVQEVASLAGMPDYFYFTKVFKKHFFMSPAQYRITKKNK